MTFAVLQTVSVFFRQKRGFLSTRNRFYGVQGSSSAYPQPYGHVLPNYIILYSESSLRSVPNHDIILFRIVYTESLLRFPLPLQSPRSILRFRLYRIIALWFTEFSRRRPFRIFASVSESESTSQDAFDSTRTAEKPEPKQDNIVLESGADSVGQASPPQAKAPEVEGAREPVCADPEGAKSCAAVEEGLIMAEPNEAGAEDNEETIEGNQQAVEAAEPMVGGRENDELG